MDYIVIAYRRHRLSLMRAVRMSMETQLRHGHVPRADLVDHNERTRVVTLHCNRMHAELVDLENQHRNSGKWPETVPAGVPCGE